MLPPVHIQSMCDVDQVFNLKWEESVSDEFWKAKTDPI